MFGLCLAAVFAVAAFTAGGASAAGPEWGKCVAKAGGKYLDAGCKTKGKGGSFEWTKGSKLPNVPFSGASTGGGGVLTTAFGECEGDPKNETDAKCEAEGHKVFFIENFIFVECTSETNTGEAVGKQGVGNVHVTFKGCAALGAIPCQNAEAPEGEIKTNLLKGKLGYINKSATPEPEVGVVLEPATKKGHFADFECPGLGLSTAVGVGSKKEGAFWDEKKGGQDKIISPITPINQMTNEFTQVYTQENDSNIPEKFEGAKGPEQLESRLFVTEKPEESGKWEKAGEEITNVNVPSEEGEIKG